MSFLGRLSLATWLVLASALSAQTTINVVGVQAAPARGMALQSAPTGVDGLYLQVGWFDVGFDVNANVGADPSSLTTLFNAFNSLVYSQTANTGTFEITRTIGNAGDFADGWSTASAASNGQPLYIFGFATNDGDAPDVGLADVTDYGIFRNTGWTVPAHAAAPTVGETFQTDVTMTASFGSVSATNLILAPVPEPAFYAAAIGLGALGLAAWRRRRQVRV